MPVTITILSPGQMGTAVGQRLIERGARVLTSLAGRSDASAARVHAAGLTIFEDDARLAEEAQFVLSILPPGQAIALAERLRPALARASTKPVYVECNAIAPATTQKIEALLKDTGCPFVDAGIVGGPPKSGSPGPRFYVSGPAAGKVAPLAELGLQIRPLDHNVGTASALKLSYASLTKGLTAIGTAMMLSASNAGVAPALAAELADSQPVLLALLKQALPSVLGKAHRWVAEMEEIASFFGDPGMHAMFTGAAEIYRRVAKATTIPEGGDLATLERFIQTIPPEESSKPPS
jgi:L-threonate 2-dehydrogenase